MNFYDPYFFSYQNVAPKATGLKALLGKINFSSIIGGTQKTLNTINQLIPIVKEARPMMDNARTLFKLMSEFNRGEKVEINETKKTVSEETVTETQTLTNDNGPTFFL